MALTQRSLFLYGFEVTPLNRSLDFRASFGGPIKQATLTLGFYSLSGLLTEIERAMQAVDSVNDYTVTADRSVNSGTENRVIISTDGSYLDLLFLTGPRNSSSVDLLIGYAHADQTGATTYTGTSTSGIALVPELVGYSYVPTTMDRRVQGAVTVSSSGEKEAVVFQVQEFLDVEFKYEPESKVITEWAPFMTWAIKQRFFEFTPDVTNYTEFIEVTLEQTDAEGKGLGYRMKEMLPDFPFFYRTGSMKFRKRIVGASFL